MNCKKEKANCNEIDIHGAFKLCQSSPLHTLIQRPYLKDPSGNTVFDLRNLVDISLFETVHYEDTEPSFKCSEYLLSSLITLGSKPYCP